MVVSEGPCNRVRPWCWGGGEEEEELINQAAPPCCSEGRGEELAQGWISLSPMSFPLSKHWVIQF